MNQGFWLNYYHDRIRAARADYLKTGDHDRYMGTCLYYAVMVGADEIAASNPKLKYLPTAITGLSHGIKGLMETIAHNFSCPVASGHDHRDFLSNWKARSRSRFDGDLAHVKEVLTHLGIS